MARRQARERKAKKRGRTPTSNGGGRTLGRAVDTFDDVMRQFRNQLKPLGLDVKNVEADGNCLFRAISDQLEGHEDRAEELRQQCMDYIEVNKEDFQPFVEDDRDFDDYVADMRRDGWWAGNLELQALSKMLEVNIRVHQLNGPAYDVRNFTGSHARVMHLSYHSNEHYASVRPTGSSIDGPAHHKPLPGANGRKSTDAEVVAWKANVLLEEAQQMLRDCDGDMNAATESLVAARQCLIDANATRSSTDSTVENDRSGSSSETNSNATNPRRATKQSKSVQKQQIDKKKQRKERRRLEREKAAKEAKEATLSEQEKDEQKNNKVYPQPTLSI